MTLMEACICLLLILNGVGWFLACGVMARCRALLDAIEEGQRQLNDNLAEAGQTVPVRHYDRPGRN